MAHRVFTMAACTLLSAGTCLAAPGRGGGSGLRGGVAARSARTVSVEEVESSLRDALDTVLGGAGAGGRVADERLARMEASMWQTFQALPKNSAGRLAPRAVRHIVHSYFAKEHGWLINGLEHHGMQQNVSEVHEVDILQDKAPAFVEALLEARREDRGLSLGDAVAMAAVLERLIIDESVGLLRTAYTLNGQTVVDGLDAPTLREVLSSYLMIFEMGVRRDAIGNTTDVQRHQAMKRAIAGARGNWPLLVEFGLDAILNFDFGARHRTNPFVERRYLFGETSRIVEGLAQDYGKWQNTECRQMREELLELDLDGSGRVPLKAFYSQPSTANYQFHESMDYLRKIGALDERTSSVRIANYMAGPSNCVARSAYYSVCCLSDCEGMMNELESKVKAPTADAGRLLALVRNLSSSSADMRLPAAVAAARLRDIADRNGGEVPLHGRLFAEFLHHAFPADCPYPHISEDAAALTAGHWAKGKSMSSEDERRLHIQGGAGGAGESDEEEAEEAWAPGSTAWSDEEVLPVLEPQRPSRGAWSGVLRPMVQLAAALAVLRTALAGLRTATGAARGSENEKGFVLPLRI